jgi:hypothetical protein
VKGCWALGCWPADFLYRKILRWQVIALIWREQVQNFLIVLTSSPAPSSAPVTTLYAARIHHSCALLVRDFARSLFPGPR